MPAQLTTKAQVNGYRFLLRRYDHALVRQDVRMLHDPMRSQFQSLMIGAVLAVLAVAGAAILAFLHPQGAIDDAKIVMGKQTGALYIVDDGTLHPVLNLASARLITGSSESPTSVQESKLTMPRGPLLGIAGAPAALPGPGDDTRSTWTLCDSVQLSPAGNMTPASGAESTVIAGTLSPEAGGARPARANQALLVTRAGKTFLLYGGKRAELDPADPVVVRSLGLQGKAARPATAGLLNSAVPAPAITAPRIDHLGDPGPGRLSGIPIGALIRASSIDSERLYVVLAGGVQPVSPFAAELIRNANSQGLTDIVAVAPDRLVDVPVVDSLPIDQFPQVVPEILAAEQDPVGCISWSRDTDAPNASITMLAGRALPLSSSQKPVTLASATGPGDHVYSVYVPPSTGEYVQVVSMATNDVIAGPLFYVADNGIRYGVPDAKTAAVLGLPKKPQPAPGPIIEALVPGPSLDRSSALASHDALPQSPS
ncbi:type VII secretion protein EccB [Nocardia sp. CDC160]|uniref:type VII secretion protein EccB n=1 Tax=Nocardia sp. CDC160 TaxID=3112166 RepID=UPI002DBDC7E2|nr:type VII secretion protein EccB [Nocardia sp. CDC160]MEC3919263.1 type VII secretion protein EccB [Nocardia sp. CDC160]